MYRGIGELEKLPQTQGLLLRDIHGNRTKQLYILTLTLKILKSSPRNHNYRLLSPFLNLEAESNSNVY